jgi:hypothetical protein
VPTTPPVVANKITQLVVTNWSQTKMSIHSVSWKRPQCQMNIKHQIAPFSLWRGQSNA